MRKQNPIVFVLILSIFLVVALTGCSEKTRGHFVPSANPQSGDITLALAKGFNNEYISVLAVVTSGTLTEVVSWEVDGILRASGGQQPVDGVSGIKTNPLYMETLLFGLSKFTGFTVRGTFRLTDGSVKVTQATFLDVFPTSPGLLDTTSTVTSSPLPDRRTITLNFTLQALTGLVPPQRVNCLVEQVNTDGTRFQLANSQLGVGPVTAQFTPSTVASVRVTLTTPSGQTLQFQSPLVLEFTQLGIGGTETKVSLPSDVGL
ncbi:MAG: hypothetical protein AB7J46_02900 [Candidatus Altimarinota bacterium]